MKHQARAPAARLELPLERWRAGFAVGIGMAAATALAQTVPVQSVKQAAEPAYVDKVIEGLPDMDGGIQLKSSEYNEAGWPRSWRVDYSLFRQTGGGDSTSRALGLGGFVDTPNYGALSINANLVQQSSTGAGSPAQSSSTWRIDQRGLPLDGGWFANHSAGDINTVSTRLARGTGRVSVPATPIRGIGGQWYLNDAIDLNAAAGRTGLFNGLDVTGFETSGGSITSAGAQFRLPFGGQALAGGRSDAALQLIDGKSITDGAGLGTAQNTRAYFAAASWEGAAPWASDMAAGYGSASERVGGLRLQANMVQSDGTRDGGATGLWLDAAWRTERWRNSAGIFRFEPNLRWGTSVLASDLQGVYWQADTSTRQWQAGFAAELSDSVSTGMAGSGASGRSAFVNVNGRYLLDTRNSVGAALSFRTITSPGQAVQLTWNRTGDWGQTQWRGDLANASGVRTTRFGVDQSWPLIWPASLSTSLAFERITGNITPTSGWIWGVLGTLSPWQQWSLDGSVRGARRSDGGESLNANVGVNWQPYGGWSLSLRYTESRGQEPLAALVVSALTAATQQAIATTQKNRSIQLLLRYEDRAGTATAPLGGLPGTGAGGLSGSVFFDADANGQREASEGGVPGVTVILDRRYVTRTDAQGRYEFPSVAAGEHLIEVSPDNVPLPWSPVLRDPVKTVVLVRQSHSLNFAVQRER